MTNNATFEGSVTAGALVGLGNGITNSVGAHIVWTSDVTTSNQLAAGVSSFNTRTGAVTLVSGDITTALGFTPLANTAQAVTNALGYIPAQSLSTNSLATTGYVNQATATLLGTNGNGGNLSGIVVSFQGRNGAVVLNSTDVTGALGFVPVNSSVSLVNTFQGRSGTVTLQSSDVTGALGFTPLDATATKVTTFNTRSGAVTLSSSDVTTALGYTPPQASITNSFATQEYVVGTSNALSAKIASASAGVSSFNTRTGAVTLSSSDVTTALGFTPVNSSVSLVNTFQGRSGTVTLSSADVTGALGFTPMDSTATKVATFNSRSGAVTLTSSDVTTALGYTPPQASITNDFATQAYVVDTSNVLASATKVTTFNTRSGAVTLQGTDVTTALGFVPLDSAATKVTTFNTRSGAVTLQGADVTSALGYTPLAQNGNGGSLSGVVTTFNGMSGPITLHDYDVVGALQYTPMRSDATKVTTFNSRSGTVTLSSADVTGALGFTPMRTDATYVSSLNGRSGSVTLTEDDVVSALDFRPANSATALVNNQVGATLQSLTASGFTVSDTSDSDGVSGRVLSSSDGHGATVWASPEGNYSTATGSSGTYTVNLAKRYQVVSYSGNITFNGYTTPSGDAVSAVRTTVIEIPRYDTADRTLTFPQAWVFVGTKPTSLAATKIGVLSLTHMNNTIIAAWGAQQ